MVTFPVGGDPLECFYHHIFTNDTTVVRYIEELGLGEKLKLDRAEERALLQGQDLPLRDADGPREVHGDPVHQPRARLGLAALWLRRQHDWKKYEGITAREWMERAVGKKAFKALWGPLLKAKFAGRRRRRRHGLALGQDLPALRLAARARARRSRSATSKGSFRRVLPGAGGPHRAARRRRST